MNAQSFSGHEWQSLHEEIQKRFHALAGELAPTAQPRYGKTVTKLFPLFSHVSFSLAKDGTGNEIIVGVDIGPENEQWRIDADISDEEEGTIYFEVPRTPFSVATFDEMKNRVLRVTEQLINGGKPVLVRLLGVPTLAPAVHPAGASEVAHNV